MSENKDMPVVLLAAGRGVRLGDLTAEIPKCMLPLSKGTIIERQIGQLQSLGLRNIHIVTGYMSDNLKEHLNGYDVNFIDNPAWDKSNNIYSLYLARDVCLGGFYLLNSDVVCHSGILERFVSTNGTAMVVDDYKELGDEEMKVVMEEGRITDISKQIPPHRADGEYIGILRFSAEDSVRLFDEIEDFVKREEVDVWYENAIKEILDEVSITGVSTGGLDWIEVDTQDDYRSINNLRL